MVLFIAPVTPELQCDPKLIHEINNTANSFASSGGGCFSSIESEVDPASGVGPCASSWAGANTTSATDFETESLVAMANYRISAGKVRNDKWED